MKRFFFLLMFMLVVLLSVGQTKITVSIYQQAYAYNGSFLVTGNSYLHSYSFLGEFYDRVMVVNGEDRLLNIFEMEYRVNRKFVKDTTDGIFGKVVITSYDVVDFMDRACRVDFLSKGGNTVRVDLYAQEIQGLIPKAYRTVYLLYILK